MSFLIVLFWLIHLNLNGICINVFFFVFSYSFSLIIVIHNLLNEFLVVNNKCVFEKSKTLTAPYKIKYGLNIDSKCCYGNDMCFQCAHQFWILKDFIRLPQSFQFWFGVFFSSPLSSLLSWPRVFFFRFWHSSFSHELWKFPQWIRIFSQIMK